MIAVANPPSASLVDPNSIELQTSVGVGAELLVRRRPSGSVELANGQREHVLMCTVGRPVGAREVRSVLQTDGGRREWTTCPQGHVTFLPSGLPLQWSWSYASQSIHLTMLPSFLGDVGADLAKKDGEPPPLMPFFRTMNDGLKGLLTQLRDETTSGGLGKDLVTSSLLLLIAVHIYRSGPAVADRDGAQDPAGLSPSDCRRCRDILSDRLDENIPLSELAAEFGLSPFHFARMFKLAMGFPPHEYQLQLRIARARELLGQRPKTSLAAMACDLGFSDESHFRRHFKRIVGTTPGRFRAQQ